MRQSMQRYVPPSRRNQPSEPASFAETERRGLDGAAPGISQVRLVVLAEDLGFDPASCPLDIERQQSGDSAHPAEASRSRVRDGAEGSAANSNGASPAVFLIFFPDRLPNELLPWFKDTFPGGTARLEFPPSLSKAERARWHGAASRLHLHTESVGIGEGRYLTVGTTPFAAEGGDAGGGAAAGPDGVGSRPRLTQEQKERADLIWKCAQMEGGRHWERSRGEVEAMVASGQPLPRDLQELLDKRLRGEEVHRLLAGGQPSEALSLLSEDAKLAWVKDEQTGGYPIHQAAWKVQGYESVVLFLASLPGVLEQRDGRRETALAVARRRRHTNIEELLIEVGANPAHASFTSADTQGPAGVAEADEGDSYCSWSVQERMQYRRGGMGGSAPPGLSRGRARHSGRGGRGRGSGTEGGGRAANRSRPEQPLEGRQQARCPW